MNISPGYLALNEKYHRDAPNWGTSAGRFRAVGAMKLAVLLEAQTILDYGCGKGTMQKASGLVMDEYDPAIPGKTEIPRDHYDLVICTDVMEHVEPEYVDSVLNEINDLATLGVYFIVYLTPAMHTLPDGSNCHRTIKPATWWAEKIKGIFKCTVSYTSNGTEAEIIVAR